MVKYVLFSLIATCFFLSCTLNTTANKSEATAPKCDSLLLNTEQMVNDTLWQFGSHCEFVLKDSASAYLYYKQSANNGNAIGYYMLGHALQHGIGVEENSELSDMAYRKSVDMLTALLNQNEDKVLLNFLGSAYYWGDGVPQDRTKAAQLYLRSAELGNPETQYKIATCYEQGIGVEQDLNRAMHWYQESAKQGWPDAVTRLNQ